MKVLHSKSSKTIRDLEFDPVIGAHTNIRLKGNSLCRLIDSFLNKSTIIIHDPFDKDSKQIEFVNELEEICF